MRKMQAAARTVHLAGIVGLCALAGAVGAHADAVLASWSGKWARYEAIEPPSGHPRATEAVLSVVPGADADTSAWIRWEARTPDGLLFAFETLVDSAALLSPLSADGNILRYILRPPGTAPLEYVDLSGRALLPPFSFDPLLVPKLHGATPQPDSLPAAIDWLGRAFRRVETGGNAQPWSRDDVRRLELDPEVLVGTSRSFRDDGTGRERDLAGRSGDYRYVELREGDYREMIDAGMNLFRVPASHLPWVIDEPVFFVTYEQLGEHPELLYRSNYVGAVMYMDEPAHRLLSRSALSDMRSPAEGADLLVDVTRGRFESDSGYGRRFLAKMLRRAGFAWGAAELLPADLPVWEAVTGAVWYELEAGPPGVCLEGRFQPRTFASLVGSALDVDFPDDARSCILAHVAQLRGAARHFDARWGIAVYGQMDPAAADRTFPLAYRRGATYFWLWTSGGDHHVPWTRQLELARNLRELVRQERDARAGAARAPIRAGTALVLPWGYEMDEYALRPFARGEAAELWRSPRLALEAENGAGATYGGVLAAGFREAARLLRAGEEYDILYLRPDEQASGYDTVVRVRESGEVERP